jgi:hypothetical protein
MISSIGCQSRPAAVAVWGAKLYFRVRKPVRLSLELAPGFNPEDGGDTFLRNVCLSAHTQCLVCSKQRRTIKNPIFWDLASCGFSIKRRFGRTCLGQYACNHLTISFARDISSSLKMETKRSSETSVYNKHTQHHIPADGIIHSYRRETLKSWRVCQLHNGNLTICSVLVKALRSKPECCGFETRWGKLFLIYLILPAALGPEVYWASKRNE